MDDSPTESTLDTSSESQFVHPARLVVFAIMSLAFVAWVAFGYIEARVWVSGQLTLLDRRISSMWQYLGHNLPNLPASAGITLAYWLSLSFIVIGTVAGLWLFLGTADEDPNNEPIEVIQAAHLKHESE